MYPSSSAANAAGFGAGTGAGAMAMASMHGSRSTDALDAQPYVPPMPAFGSRRTGSIGSMDTTELHASEPMVAGGAAGGWYHDVSPDCPDRKILSTSRKIIDFRRVSTPAAYLGNAVPRHQPWRWNAEELEPGRTSGTTTGADLQRPTFIRERRTLDISSSS
jgi:hypothetical protein